MGNQIKGFNCRSACGYEGDFGDFPRKKTIQDFNPELIQKNNNDSNSNDLSQKKEKNNCKYRKFHTS